MELPSAKYTAALKRAAAKKKHEKARRGQLLRHYRRDLSDAGIDEKEKTSSTKKRLREEAPHEAVADSEKDVAKRKKNRKKAIEPFSKEKKVAQASRESKASASAKRREHQRERGMKINKRKKNARSYKQRDSQGRPLISNSIGRILDKLQSQQG